MKEQVMVLLVRENTKAKFYEKDRARLLDGPAMEKLADLAATGIRIGCEIKVEVKEMEV